MINDAAKTIEDLIHNKRAYDQILHVLLNANLQWDKKTEKNLHSPIRSFHDRKYEDVLAHLIIYIYLKKDEAIDFARKRGLFAYYTDWEGTVQTLEWLSTNKDRLAISEENRTYFSHKYDIRWMADYYKSCEHEIDSIIERHEARKLREKINGHDIESNIAVELLVLMELLFRLPADIVNSNKSAAIECLRELDYDFLGYYSRESMGEAVSFLISRYCELYKIEKNKCLWLDAKELTSNMELGELILLAAKRNKIVEWEVSMDYCGYDIDHIEDPERDADYVIVDKQSIEKTIQLGYIKTDMQEEARNCSYFRPPNEVMYLYSIAEKLEKISDHLFKIVDKDTFMARYQMIIYEPIVEALAPKDYETPQFYMEEWVQVANAAHEMFILEEDLLNYGVTEHCNIKDIILFKRFFTLIAYMYRAFFEKVNGNPEIVAKSAVPVFQKADLISLTDRFVGDKKKASDLIDFFSWDGVGKLDLQTTPIIKLNEDQYYLMPFLLASSNLIRNGIVRGRQSNSQRTNSNGVREPLELYAEKLFEDRKDVFSHVKNCSFVYGDRSGEVDLVVWSKKHLYLIECKNSILPTSPFELRTTYDYIIKAQKQLDLSSEALRDDDFRERLLKNWGIPYTDYEIHTMILLGNRLFTSPNGFPHSIRYVHELHMLFADGIINSSFGKWRYWRNESFSENDFLRYISNDDPMLNDFLDAMAPYRIVMTWGDHRIEQESYSLNILKHFELDDRNLVALNTEEHLKRREAFRKEHEETIEAVQSHLTKDGFRT